MEQRSEEWHSFRKKHVGASEIAALTGDSPWMKPYDLWLKKTGQNAGDKDNFAMQRGRDAEPTIKVLYEKKTGNKITSSPTLEYKDCPLLSASLDGFVEDKQLVVEFKYASKDKHAEAEIGNVPACYYPQLQQQMLVAGVDHADYVSFNGKNIVIVRCHADKSYQQTLVDLALEFWTYVSSKTPPPDAPDIRSKDDAMVKLFAQYESISRQLVDLDMEKQRIRNQIKAHVSAERKMICNRYTASYYTRKGAVDYKKVPELEGVDLEQYRKRGTTVFTISERKEKDD